MHGGGSKRVYMEGKGEKSRDRNFHIQLWTAMLHQILSEEKDRALEKPSVPKQVREKREGYGTEVRC